MSDITSKGPSPITVITVWNKAGNCYFLRELYKLMARMHEWLDGWMDGWMDERV